MPCNEIHARKRVPVKAQIGQAQESSFAEVALDFDQSRIRLVRTSP